MVVKGEVNFMKEGSHDCFLVFTLHSLPITPNYQFGVSNLRNSCYKNTTGTQPQNLALYFKETSLSGQLDDNLDGMIMHTEKKTFYIAPNRRLLLFRLKVSRLHSKDRQWLL